MQNHTYENEVQEYERVVNFKSFVRLALKQGILNELAVAPGRELETKMTGDNAIEQPIGSKIGN